MGTREAAPNVDFSNIQLDQDVEDQVREAAVVSMGTEISLEDMTNIVELCDQARAPPVTWPEAVACAWDCTSQDRGQLHKVRVYACASPSQNHAATQQRLNAALKGGDSRAGRSPGVGRRPHAHTFSKAAPTSSTTGPLQ